MNKAYDYEYFVTRVPYRNIFKELCDLDTYSWRAGHGSYAVQHYSISYDQEKFVKNLPLIKEKMLKTKFAKTIKEEAEYIKALPNSLDDFHNAYEINGVATHLICNGCIRKGASSIRYEWDVKPRYSDNVEFNIACAKKMDRPMVTFTEYNGWEREVWNFYFDFPRVEDLNVLSKFRERLSIMPEIDQRVGKTHYELKLVPVEYTAVNWNSKRTSYMPHNNLMTGNINVDKINEIIDFSNDALFEFCYKGGVRALFDEEAGHGV